MTENLHEAQFKTNLGGPGIILQFQEDQVTLARW